MPSPSRPAVPAKPRPPKALELATVDEDDLRDEGAYTGLGFYDLDLTGRSAKGAEFDQCRFNRTDLSGTSFVKVSLTDCLVESSNFANLHGDQSSLLRVAVKDSRLTGLQLARRGAPRRDAARLPDRPVGVPRDQVRGGPVRGSTWPARTSPAPT